MTAKSIDEEVGTRPEMFPIHRPSLKGVEGRKGLETPGHGVLGAV